MENELKNDLTQNELHNVYMALSITDDVPFDAKEETQFLLECIEDCFETKFLQIDEKVLQVDTNQINNSFVLLIKFCTTQRKFKKPATIFINYCDYFNLDYNKTYLQLHNKLQYLIEHGAKNLIGIKEYNKHKLRSNNGIIIKTLFDLI